MKKSLRFMFAAALMMFGMTAMAENVIWFENFSSFADYCKVEPNNINDNYTFTGTTYKDDGSYNSGTAFYNEKIAGGEAPELLVAKNGGTFTAKVDLKGATGEMTLTFKCNKKLTITAVGAEIGELTNTGNDYSCPVTVAAGTSEITITFTNSLSSNARLDNIKLYQGTAKKPAGITWGKASTTLYLGEEVTLALQNENNLSVEYTSSEETVATISKDGVITLVAAGETTLTASFKGNDEYEAAEVSIKVSVKEKEQGGGDDEVKTVTVAQFNAAEVSTTVWYQLTGTVKNLKDGDQYGNFDLEDESGSVYVYGLLSEKGGAKKEFQTLATEKGIKNGSKLTLIGNRGVFNDKIEVVNAYFVSVTNSDPTAISSVKAEAQQGVAYNLQGQQVMQPMKGLYIINGKKVVMK